MGALPMNTYHLKEDIKRIAKLAAGVTDAFTSAILLPVGFLGSSSSSLISAATDSDSGRTKRESLEILGAHSLASSLIRDCRIPVGAGLLGWVAENGRPIHLAPFESENTSIGIYAADEEIRSLIAVPIALPVESTGGVEVFGVLMCDSRTSSSFSKTQVKNVEEVAQLTSRLLFWGLMRRDVLSAESSWRSFTIRAGQLSEAIGIDSVEILRISIENIPQLEARLGTTRAIEATEQFVRLIQQALPPHFPVVRMPSGDILVALDNMMSSFFQQKFSSLAARPDRVDRSIAIETRSYSAKGLQLKTLDVDTVLQQGPSSVPLESPITKTKTVAGGGTRA
jgi:hypothetical protein